MAQQLSRSKAKQLTLVAQAAAIVFAGAAVAVAGLGMPGLAAPDPQWADSPADTGATAASEAAREAAAETGPPAFELIDPDALAQRLSLVDNSPLMPIDDSSVSDDSAATIDDPEADVLAGDVELRFLGLIDEPRRRVALLSIEGRQRFLTVGDVITTTGGSLEILDIAAHQVQVELDGTRQTVTRKKSDRPSVTMIQGGEVNTLEAARSNDRAGILAAQRGWTGDNIQPGSLPRGRRDVPDSVRNRRARQQEAAERGEYSEQRRRARENANQEIIRRKPTAPNLGGSGESSIRWSQPSRADDNGRSPPE